MNMWLQQTLLVCLAMSRLSRPPTQFFQMQKEIETLYWKIYGTWHITNKLMIWFVKGWIVKWNGHGINWVIVVTMIIKEKNYV
jgi:hypothetical protein